MLLITSAIVPGVKGSQLVLSGVEKSPPLSSPHAGAMNVVLVVMDTVRADHLGLYGYRRKTTPNLERLAARVIRYDQARGTAP